MARLRALLLVSLTGCALRDVPGPPGQEQVVVQGVLNAQTAQQALWIERTIPAGERVSREVRPLDPPPTRVEVHDSTGLTFTFQLDTIPGRFVAAFTPTPGGRYDLLIEAGGRVLHASTRVPDATTIVNPASDTVILAPSATLALVWSGPIRAARVAYADSMGQAYYGAIWVTGDTAVELTLGSVRSLQVWVLSVDSVTARVGDAFVPGLDPASLDQLRGNVTGGAGFFGAATADHVVVRRP